MASSIPIMENPQVKELLAIMEKNQLSNLGTMTAMLNQVSTLEGQLKQAVSELTAIREELQDVREKQRPMVQKAFNAAQAQTLALGDKLNALKQTIVASCEKALSAVRQKGISALGNISQFFKIRPLLEGVRGQAEKCLASLEKLEACAEAAKRPSLRETLEQNAERSKQMFGTAPPTVKPQEQTR